MSWYGRRFQRFRELPMGLMILHITCKTIFTFGLGALLASYLKGANWQMIGWVLIVVSLVLAIPSSYAILKK
jgi:Na+-driven multidrug efflux pump